MGQDIPTNELIITAADLYLGTLALVNVPAAFLVIGYKGRAGIQIDADECAMVGHAESYWGEYVAEPLEAAHQAIHAVSAVSLSRMAGEYASDSAAETMARAELTLSRATIAQAERDVRESVITRTTSLTTILDHSHMREVMRMQVIRMLRDL